MTACFSGLSRHLHRLFDILGRIGLVLERPAGQARQLPMMAVGEYGEILPVRREIVGEPGSGQRIGERIGREARHALLAIGDDGLAGRLRALDRIEAGGILLPLEVLVLDLAGIIVGEGVLQLHRPRQRSDGFGRDWHCVSPWFSTPRIGVGRFLECFRKASAEAAIIVSKRRRSATAHSHVARAVRRCMSPFTPATWRPRPSATIRGLSKLLSHWPVLRRPPNGKR